MILKHLKEEAEKKNGQLILEHLKEKDAEKKENGH